MTKKLFALFSVLLVTGCWTLSCTPHRDIKTMKKSKAPDWVSGIDDDYDSKEFLTGVGQGDTRPTADDQARTMLLKNISVERRVDQTLPLSLNQRWAKAVDESLRNLLAGAKIKEHWQDETARNFSLAVVRRSDLSKAILQRADDLAAKIDAQPKSQSVDEAQPPVENLRRYLKIAPWLYEREILLGEILPVVDSAASTAKPAKTYARVEETLVGFTRRIAIRVDLAGQGSQTLKDLLFEDLNRSQFRVLDAGDSRSDFILKGAINTAPVDNDDPSLQWLRSEITADLIDGQNQKVFGKIRQAERQGAKQADKAERAALRHLSQSLSDEVNQRLVDYFDGVQMNLPVRSM